MSLFYVGEPLPSEIPTIDQLAKKKSAEQWKTKRPLL